MNIRFHSKFLGTIFSKPQQVSSVSWADRSVILDEAVNLFCWERPANSMITGYLEQLLVKELKTIEFRTNLSRLNGDLQEARLEWDNCYSEAAEVFWQDIFKIARDFLVSFSSRGSGALRLKVVEDDACTRFHTDGYPLRLFTTYHGSGTEWLPEIATYRKGLGKSDCGIVKGSAQVRQMAPFEIGILKGEVPGRLSFVKGIVHRSPKIKNSGDKRVTLRIDI